MRVALVAPLVKPIREPQLGGAQAFVADLARGMSRRGHDVEVYAASGSVLADVELVDVGVDHRALARTLYRESGAGTGGDDAAASAFADVYAAVRTRHYDVVHNHAFDAPAVSLAEDLGAAVVHTLHLPPQTAVASAVREVTARGPRATIACVSAWQRRAWAELVRVEEMLPPYVPTGSIPFAPAPGAGAVFAGRLSPEKGAAEAIDIARAAGIAIEVFGDRYDAEYVREQIQPRRGEAGVSIHDAVPRASLWRAMGRAAVVLCPARWDEPFGMVAAEAQACGTPVVAFRRGALEEVIVDGVTGRLVAPDDLAAAAAAAREAPALSRAQCREHARRHLDLGLTLDAHERVYARVSRAAGQRAIAGG